MKKIGYLIVAVFLAGLFSCYNAFNDVYNEVFRGKVFVGGSFNPTPSYLAKLDFDTGELLSWNQNPPDAPVQTLAVMGDTVYVGGNFITIGGQTRKHLAAFDRNTGELLPWNPDVNTGTVVNSIVVVGDTVYVGGAFTQVGGQDRNNLAAVDRDTGALLPWNPTGINALVNSIAIWEDTVYAGGSFNFGTQYFIAAFDRSTGARLPWNPNVTGGSYVVTVAVEGDTVYIGGNFTNVGVPTRRNFAAVDRSTGAVLSWDLGLPGATNIYTITVTHDTIYMGGVGYLAAYDCGTHALQWNPVVSGTVYSLSVTGDTVYIGGRFVSVGGQDRGNLAAIDRDSGKPLSRAWEPTGSYTVKALCVSE